MRYIDRTNCKSMRERGADREISSMGKLTKTAVRIAEERGLGLLKTHWGPYKVIRRCGLGAYPDTFATLAEVDAFLKGIKKA